MGQKKVPKKYFNFFKEIINIVVNLFQGGLAIITLLFLKKYLIFKKLSKLNEINFPSKCWKFEI